MSIEPATLDGAHVRLEPLDLAKHWDGLLAIGLDEDLWRFTVAKVKTAQDLRTYLDAALNEQARGVSIPFANIHKASGRVAGCSRFGNIVAEHKRAEIGWTWVGREYQRSAVNTEAKLLMFTHAFEVWGLNRVELKTSHLNLRSQSAMRRLGLVEEGTMRKHTINADGTIRHTVYFSVTDDEWPAMKSRLQDMLAKPR
jgi:RimJ/RimL family protein N-acetyltransferase